MHPVRAEGLHQNHLGLWADTGAWRGCVLEESWHGGGKVPLVIVTFTPC